MTVMNEGNYVQRTVRAGKNPTAKSSKRDWWFVRHARTGIKGIISLGEVMLPKEMIGKKVRIKIELLKEKNDEAIHGLMELLRGVR